MTDPTEPTTSVSMSYKLNLDDYENAEVFVSLSGVRAGMTAEQLAPLLTTQKLAYDLVRASLVEKLRPIREERDAKRAARTSKHF